MEPFGVGDHYDSDGVVAWHPSGMRTVMGWWSGGVAALNHRLMSFEPSGFNGRSFDGFELIGFTSWLFI
ncbi:hypothetical protein CVU37_12820 [candidate division BRC1 bacterium HGW-BRC1-1]|nr:MAG: hypothetical protein CVU37_12820 [candidate division BRC1 bacterium HGW-BRC1-1]